MHHRVNRKRDIDWSIYIQDDRFTEDYWLYIYAIELEEKERHTTKENEPLLKFIVYNFNQ